MRRKLALIALILLLAICLGTVGRGLARFRSARHLAYLHSTAQPR